jgi:hypothetical protein
MPHLSGLRVGGVVSHAKRVVIRAAVESERAPCSVCGVPARRVHSSYQRQLVDPAIAGREAMIELTVRRFFCDNTACGRKTFVEQVSGLTTRFGRRDDDGAAAGDRSGVRPRRPGRLKAVGLARDPGRTDDTDSRDPYRTRADTDDSQRARCR